MKKKRVALYLRVSTNNGRQTVENQQRELEAVAERSGWEIVATYADKISGAKGRDKRPGLEAMMKAATRREFDCRGVVGRPARPEPAAPGPAVRRLSGPERGPLPSPAARRQQHAVGRALLQMSGVFAEFERAILQERINAGLARARAEGKHLGRRRTPGATDAAILTLRSRALAYSRSAGS